MVVELEPAPLGGDRDAQRVAGEHQIGAHLLDLGLGFRAAAAPLARPVDLHHALRGREVARRRHLGHDGLDVGAEELERLVALLANEVEVPRLAVRMLEPGPPLAEVHLARDPGVHHPLQRPVDGGAADAAVLLADQVDQVVGAEVPVLAHERVDNLLPLAGSACRRG